jgi:hypothetical protein
MKKVVWYILAILIICSPAWAWHDETHLSIAKAAGYNKWYNAAGADMAKIKAGGSEKRNHYVNNPQGTVVTARMVLGQAAFYNKSFDLKGHLYGAIIASIREYKTTTLKGKYAEYHLAFCAHYVGDLSQPLHNTLYNGYNRRNHSETDGIIDDEVLDNLDRIEIYPIEIETEIDLAEEIARIANLSMKLGYQLQKKGRMLSKQEAYRQISHSASLFKAILKWVGK